MATFDLHDIQGIILRGYRMPVARYVMLHITNVAGARHFLAAIVRHDPSLHAHRVNRGADATPQITTAAHWGHTKPDYCLNLGLTFAGLAALQVPQADLGSFPAEFQAGAYAPDRAALVGDTGASAPTHWLCQLDPANAPNVHIVLVVYGMTEAALEATTTTLRALWAQHDGLTELARFDAKALEAYADLPQQVAYYAGKPFPKVHFGYTDGISQPTIANAPPTHIPDMQPVAPTGEFVLGYPNQFSQAGYPVPTPSALGENGSFAAFRILKQDVAGFEHFLDTQATPDLSKEVVAAKLCGRWRNGVPLVLSPTTDTPELPLTHATIDYFDYMPNPAYDFTTNDKHGLRCPIGAHMRRTNPRGAIVQGSGHTRRIVRRAVPYGPPYDPTQPDDGRERGLVGLFINGSLAQQFEFIMQQWVNDSTFTFGLTAPDGVGTKDVFLGSNDDDHGVFLLPTESGTTVITGFSRFVITRGSAYLFLPSMTALQYLSDPDSAPSEPASAPGAP
jgi:deferrochelatase/peroxidase EfeB